MLEKNTKNNDYNMCVRKQNIVFRNLYICMSLWEHEDNKDWFTTGKGIDLRL